MALLSCYFYQIASSSNLLQPSGRDLDFDTFFIQFTAGNLLCSERLNLSTLNEALRIHSR